MKKFLTFILVLLFLGSCSYYKSIEVESAKLTTFKIESTSSVRVTFSLKVINDAKTSISVADISGTLYKDGNPFADVSLIDIPTIEACSTGCVPLNVKAKLINPIALLSTGLNIGKWKIDDFTVTGKLILKSGTGIRKTFKVRKMPLKKFVGLL